MMLLPTGIYGTSGPLGPTVFQSGTFDPKNPTFRRCLAWGSIFIRTRRPRVPSRAVPVHWNGAKVAEAAIDRAKLNWVEGTFHRVQVRLGAPKPWRGPSERAARRPGRCTGPFDPFNGPVTIPGMTWSSYRLAFAARTGGLTSSFDLGRRWSPPAARHADCLAPRYDPSPVPWAHPDFDLAWGAEGPFQLVSTSDVVRGTWVLESTEPVYRSADAGWTVAIEASTKTTRTTTVSPRRACGDDRGAMNCGWGWNLEMKPASCRAGLAASAVHPPRPTNACTGGGGGRRPSVKHT